MADTLTPVHPLAAWAARFADLPAGLEVTAEPLVAAADLRLDPATPASTAVADLLGAAVPTTPNTWVATPHGRIAWLGPNEWLVRDDSRAPHELEALLRVVVAAADVSAQRTELRLAGPLVRELLALGCSLDLHPSAFPPGNCAQTTLGQVGVVLLATVDAFHVLVWPSFAGHLADWLLDAAIEFSQEQP